MQFLSIDFFYRKEVALFASTPMIKKGDDLKIVSKFVLKQLFDYNISNDIKDFYSRKVNANTRKSSLL